MAASVFDSPLFAQLFNTGDAGRLFSDSAAIRAMLLVEGALAKVQGSLGIIPEMSAAAIHRASLEIQVDPGAIAASTGENGVSVPGLLAQFRAEMQAPEFAQHVHWGATSQDIIDTALMLRLRQALKLAETDLREIIAALAAGAEQHQSLPMPAPPMASTPPPPAGARCWRNGACRCAMRSTSLRRCAKGRCSCPCRGQRGRALPLVPRLPRPARSWPKRLGCKTPGAAGMWTAAPCCASPIGRAA